MVLFSFSIPKHIPLILSGSKAQTTRIPRKPRKNGEKPYSVGEKVQLYYRSRQKADCLNCLLIHTSKCPHVWVGKGTYCNHHSNFFGEYEIKEIFHYSEQDHVDMCEKTHTALCGNEIWVGHTIGHLDDEEKDGWAIQDGFKNWDEACDFFEESNGDPEWMYRDFDVIRWDGSKVVEASA